ncbi:MAG: RluA family pseudouridine synthase [Mycoplasmataceae bacterium]|nr:RluA family pseudouridine synthase [Mycoplasmataceae bacterium]
MHKFEYKEEDIIRLDKFLVESLKDKEISRTNIEKLIKEGCVTVNEKKASKPGTKVSKGDLVIINKDSLETESDAQMIPEDMNLDIVYEDNHLLVVNKPSGIVVHPSIGHPSGTLINGIIFHTNGKILEISEVEDDIRPGIVHRLDKDTCGLIIVAKTHESKKKLSEMIKNREITKHYHALVKPKLEYQKGVIDAPIGRDSKNRQKMAVTDFNSKESTTYFEVVKTGNDWELVKVELVTGRTHQIRVHFDFIKHPILNDPLYGNNPDKTTDYGQFLQASNLKFNHPITKEELNLSIDLPAEFYERMNK